jgi:tetratricopeptide (TPR) repeat protein
MRALIASVVMTIAIGSLALPAVAGETSGALATQAFLLCKSVDRLALDDPRPVIEEGIRLSEAAVAADPHDARAQLALFCNLGRQLDLGGLSWRSFGRLRRAKAAIDRAHELAPGDTDVLIAKGEMLRRLPAALGGDKATAFALLRRAVELKPDDAAVCLHLARATAADGAPDARARISEAIVRAERNGAAHEESEARALLASLDQ